MSSTTTVLAPNGNLGYGFPEQSLTEGLRSRPHMIGADGGSNDPGPYYLGAGVSFTGREAVKRDLRLLLTAARELGIPIVVGSCGGAGGEPHLEWTFEILSEIAAEKRIRCRVALIHAEQSRDSISAAYRSGKLSPLTGAPDVTEDVIRSTTRIVGQMGYEPIQAALEAGADVVLAGRSCDVSIYAAVPIMRGCDIALAIHAAKIVECGAFCAVPSSATDCMIATIGVEEFVLEAPNPERRVSAASAAAHSLYEQPHVSQIVEPIGVVDLQHATFEELPDGTVRSAGATFERAERYTVKLEGVTNVGFRAVSIAGVQDPIAAREIDSCVDAARIRVADVFGEPGQEHSYAIHTHTWGASGLNGTPRAATGADVALVLEVVAENQHLASQVCSLARSTMLHHNYPGRIAVGGNLAILFSPHDVAWGPAFEFSVYHLWEVDDPLDPFPVETREL